MQDQQLPRNEDHVVTADQKLNSRLQKVTEQLKKFSRQKYTQMGLVVLLLLSVPLTVVLSMRQQDIRQQAAAGAGSFTLKDGTVITSVTQLEQKLLNNSRTNADGSPRNNGSFPIGYEDYNLCPNEQPGQPGSINATEAHARALEYTGRAEGGGTCEDTDGQDPWHFFGSVKSSTGADVFFTSNEANSEARWAGSCVHRSAHCHDRGCMYYAVDGPDSAKVGGWEYKRSQDTACFAISTWSCARSGWSKVMGYAQRKINDRYDGIKVPSTKGQMMDRRCALAVAVIEMRQECRNGGESCANPEALGFTAPTSILGSTGSTGGSNTPTALRSPGADSQTCSDKTFSDLATEADKTLVEAASCLGLKQYCTVRGFEDGTLRPNEPATKAYVAAFITRYHVYVLKDWQYVDLLSIPESSLYTDIPKDYGLALEIYTAREKGLLSKTVTEFKPEEQWLFGFKGMEGANYNFSKPESGMTRGEFIKAVYAYGTTGAGKGQLSCAGSSGAAPAGAALKDPTPFTEVASDADNRVKVCGDKASLLTGHITGEPSVRAFKDKLYVFAKGREDDVYVRALTPSVTSDGILTNLANSPWTNLGKKISGDVITYLQNKEGVPSLSAIVTGKGETKAHISSTTNGTAWSSWNANTESFNSQMQTIRFTSVNNMTFSFKMGNESSENNLCMSIAAAPGVAVGANPGGTGANPSLSPSPSSNNQPVPNGNNTQPAPSEGLPQPGTGLRTSPEPQNQNVLQQFWGWLSSIF